MAANTANQRRKVLGARDLLADTFRDDEIAQYVPRRFGGLMTVERPLGRRDFPISDG